jgi:hypothetical protein
MADARLALCSTVFGPHFRMITCGQDHAHDREQQQLFEQELQAIIDRAYDTHHVCELVSALQKGLAGVIATDIIDTGGSKERMQAIAADVARYIIQAYEQWEGEHADDAERPAAH